MLRTEGETVHHESSSQGIETFGEIPNPSIFGVPKLPRK